MKPHLPENLLAKASDLCKLAGRPGRMKLVLKDGRTIYDVLVGEAGEIVMAAGKLVFTERNLRFKPADVADLSAY